MSFPLSLFEFLFVTAAPGIAVWHVLAGLGVIIKLAGWQWDNVTGARR